MLKTKYDFWYDSLPKHTQIWLKNQPIWRDGDMVLSFAFGVLIGSMLVWIL